MWIFSKYGLVFFLFFLFPTLGSAQNCNSTISGYVEDLNTGNPISYATVFLKTTQIGDVTDSLGFFKLESICNGDYHLVVSYIGCETKELYLSVSGDTTISLFLDHNSQLLNEVAVMGQSVKATTQNTLSINSESMAQNSEKDLATMLENISGLSSIKNGSGISKPVIHGLYGNRISILNNGIAQSGQQWGADHSPEIDPLVANNITVIKGVGALEYQGSSLGSVVLVEPKKINKKPHLHGEGRYFFETNGLGNGLNVALQQNHKYFAWRILGTLKKSADKRTSKYYLRNTGNREANMALQLEKSWRKNVFSDLYFSSFNAELGVLRGSHIGNITDLKEALERDIPFFTEDKSSYSIGSPFQKVNHHLLKFHTKYNISEEQWFDITYAGQYNLRKEFDVRRGDRSNKPALSLEQVSNFIEVKYRNYLPRNWELKSGIQMNRVDNANLSETGILPLIPDYIAHKYGLFGIAIKTIKKTSFELGGRYDFENRKVAAISTSLPREIVRYNNDYNKLSAIGGITHGFAKGWKVIFNTGFAQRNPEVNELYSNGLHQGVSGIEEGDTELNKEVSVKNTLSVKGKVKNRWFFEGLIYYQKIDNFIFLNPQDEIRLTIRGAFPVFKYEQTDAQLFGFDLSTTYRATEQFNIIGKYSYLEGTDLTNRTPLVYMPPNRFYGELNYKIPKLGSFQNVGLQINGKFVFEQKNLLSSQDFVAPPESYYLFGLKVSAEKKMRKLRLSMFVKAENLLNETYRDYLNRQRYFADDLGFNLVAGINISF